MPDLPLTVLEQALFSVAAATRGINRARERSADQVGHLDHVRQKVISYEMMERSKLMGLRNRSGPRCCAGRDDLHRSRLLLRLMAEWGPGSRTTPGDPGFGTQLIRASTCRGQRTPVSLLLTVLGARWTRRPGSEAGLGGGHWPWAGRTPRPADWLVKRGAGAGRGWLRQLGGGPWFPGHAAADWASCRGLLGDLVVLCGRACSNGMDPEGTAARRGTLRAPACSKAVCAGLSGHSTSANSRTLSSLAIAAGGGKVIGSWGVALNLIVACVRRLCHCVNHYWDCGRRRPAHRCGADCSIPAGSDTWTISWLAG